MTALGLLRPVAAHAFSLEPTANRKKIVILGAGLTGMTAAYELSKLGYECTILEARDRTGGRCWSIRNGSSSTEKNKGAQTARFDAGYYFNAGPSRIPHHHQLTMQYCRELGVPLEVYNNVNENAWYYAEGKGPLSNRRIRMREIHNDMRGYTTELLAKVIHQDKLDTQLSKEDTEKIVEYLRAEGGLDIDRLYKASARRGYAETPGAGAKPGKIGSAYRLADIIESNLADPDFYNVAEYTYELQMTMFQAVGGMDRIAAALEAKVKPMVRTGTVVTSIRNTPDGVKITGENSSGKKEYSADLCICTLPLPVLGGIENNFAGEVSRAIDYIPYISTGKIGLQFRRRFWEEDEDIFGGITHTNNILTQIFYPSNNYLGRKGILLGYYNFNEKAEKTGGMSYADREKLALEKGALIHPQYPKEFEHSFSVSWENTPFSMGGWALHSTQTRASHYQALLKPEGRVYFAGEHLTYLNAWMAGAFESARSVVSAIHGRVNEQQVHYPSTQQTE